MVLHVPHKLTLSSKVESMSLENLLKNTLSFSRTSVAAANQIFDLPSDVLNLSFLDQIHFVVFNVLEACCPIFLLFTLESI